MLDEWADYSLYIGGTWGNPPLNKEILSSAQKNLIIKQKNQLCY